MFHKTNVRQHTRKVKGRPINVIRHQRRVEEQLGRVGRVNLPKRKPLFDEFVKSTVSFPTAIFKEPPPKSEVVEETEEVAAHLQPFAKRQLTELDVHLLSRRMNDGKISEEEAIAIMPRDGWELESDQVEKGRKWLNNIWKNRYGIVKSSSPFEHQQEAALQSFRTAKLVGMESDDGKYFYPRYRIIGTQGRFDYSVKGGNIKFY